MPIALEKKNEVCVDDSPCLVCYNWANMFFSFLIVNQFSLHHL